jgi:uncharacterized membrane protein YqjE
LLDIVQTRLELMSNEMEVYRLRVIRLMLFSLIMFFFFCLGLVLLTLLIVVMFWDTHRFLAIGLVAAIYLCIAAGLAIYVVREVKHTPKLFSASLAELTKDRAQMEAE